jgi:hypothetical protein
MTSSGIATATHAEFDDRAPAERCSDAMSVLGHGGVVSRLPPYSKGVAPITLAQLGSFEIKAQTLFPTIYRESDFIRQVPRFAIRVVRDGQTVYQRRYSARETSLFSSAHHCDQLGPVPPATGKVGVHWLASGMVPLDVRHGDRMALSADRRMAKLPPASCEYPVRLVFRATKV